MSKTMNYEIHLSGDDLLTIISLLENAGSATLAVKVRDQMYEQRRQMLAGLPTRGKPVDKPVSDKEAVDFLCGLFGGRR